MKRDKIFVMLFLFVSIFTCNGENSDVILKNVKQLEKLDSLGSTFVGVSGSKHRFYLIYEELVKVAKPEDFILFLESPHTYVKAMGIYYIATNSSDHHLLEDFFRLCSPYLWNSFKKT